jgi:hypothetical protein
LLTTLTDTTYVVFAWTESPEASVCVCQPDEDSPENVTDASKVPDADQMRPM